MFTTDDRLRAGVMVTTVLRGVVKDYPVRISGSVCYKFVCYGVWSIKW